MTGPTYDRGWLDEAWTAWMRDLQAVQYGTSTHYPHCRDGSCTGCLPPLPDQFGLPTPTAPALGIDPARRESLAELDALTDRIDPLLQHLDDIQANVERELQSWRTTP